MPTQTQTVQSNPVADLQKWLPIITTILQNKRANKLAQKNELGQLIQTKMKSMETAEVPGDREELSKMMNVYARYETKVTPFSPLQNLFGWGGQPSKKEIAETFTPKMPPQTSMVPPPTTSTVVGKPTPDDALKQTGEQPTVETKESLINQLWNPQEFEQIRTAVKRQPMQAGQPVIGGKILQASEKDADDLAKQIYMKVVESRLAQGGMSGSGYYIPRGVDSRTGKVVMSHSKLPGLIYEDGTPYRGGPLAPLALGRAPASAVATQSLSDELLNESNKIKELYKPEYVGPIAGRYASVKEATVGLDPKRAEFNALVRKLADDVLRIKSGAQINEQEMKRMLSFLVNTNVPPSVYEARFKMFQSWLSDKIKIYNKNISSGGYIPTGGATTPAAPAKEDPLGLR